MQVVAAPAKRSPVHAAFLSVAIAAAAFVTVGVSAIRAQGAEEQWLLYRSAREPWEHDAYARAVSLETSREGPEGNALAGAASTIFAAWPTPMVESGSVRLAVVMESEGPRLVIDSNLDGSLLDERAISSLSWREPRRVQGGFTAEIEYRTPFRIETERCTIERPASE
ncbi:MAG: hypothetical protein AB1486_23300 [Planctomycetota bacterium]